MTYSKDSGAVGTGSPKPPEPDDPMHMQAESVVGDQQVMLECLIEEFARMGWDANQIARLFENPFFLASYGLAKRLGREEVDKCIKRTIERCGVFRIKISEAKPMQTLHFVKSKPK
jgi:hypothetical protein